MESAGAREIRVAIACEGGPLAAWKARCAAALLEVPGVVAVLRVEPATGAPGPSAAGEAWRRGRRLALVGELASERSVPPPAALAALPVHRDGPGQGAEAAARRAGADVLLWLGTGPEASPGRAPAGEGEGGPEPWWLEIGAPGGPEGFGEVAGGRATTEVALRAGGPGGGVLRRAVLATVRKSYARNLDAARFAAAELPAQACRAALRGAARPGARGAVAAPPGPAPTRRPPGPLALARLAARQALARAADAARWLVLHRQWNVGVADAPIEAFLAPAFAPPVRWLPAPPRRRFLADPFGRREAGALTILAEALDQADGRGRIVAIRWPDGGAPEAARAVLPLPVHASYPFLLEEGGQVYCVPETGAAGEVALHRAVEFPGRWEKVATLLAGVAARDASLVRHEGRWWLFHGEEGPNGEAWLLVHHAEALAGPWRPHAANPVRSDVRGARPGGTPFVHGGALYRPGQDGAEGYGGAVVIHRITRLTPAAFEEEVAAVVGPDPRGPYPLGVHTLSAAGGQTLLDGQRRRFVPALLAAELRKHLGRLLGRPARPPPERGG